MSEETIQVLGLTLRKPTHASASVPPSPCVYLERGFCRVCDCGKCEGGFLIDELREKIRRGEQDLRVRECDCVRRARNRKRLRDSGLERLADRCSMDSFRTEEPWQRNMKALALGYLREGGDDSFFLSGQSGCGKTHLCTALCGELINDGRQLRYLQWVRDSLRLKQAVGEWERYDKELRKWSEAELLYIDDLFKQEITDADLRLAYELLNARYLGRLPTLLSSERSLEDISAARNGEGEALAGRIYEMCGGGKWCLSISGKEKNLRFRSAPVS